MCGGCNVWAEGAGVSLVMARYWWVARQGRRVVTEAEAIAGGVDAPLAAADVAELDDPMVELTRVT